MADTQHFRMAVKTKQRIYLPLGLDRPPRRNDRHCGVPDLLWAVLRTDSRAAGLLLRHWSTAEDQLAVSRRESRVARALARRLLVEVTGISGNDWSIRYLRSGRPISMNRRRGIGPAISISHSQGWVACVASTTTAVGIDIEVNTRAHDYEGIAHLAFGAGERARIARDGPLAFYRIWTLREALAKALGVGLEFVCDGHDYFEDGPDDGAWLINRVGAGSFVVHSARDLNITLALASANIRSLARRNDWVRSRRIIAGG